MNDQNSEIQILGNLRSKRGLCIKSCGHSLYYTAELFVFSVFTYLLNVSNLTTKHLLHIR